MTISRFFQNPGGSGGSTPVGPFIPGSVLFGAADGSITEDNPNLFFDNANNRLGVGTNTPSHTLHVKTASASAGTAFYVENQTHEMFRIYNNRTIVSGGGSAATNTDHTFNATTGSGASNYTFAVVGTGSDNILRVRNANGLTESGVEIVRTAATSRVALAIFGGASPYMRISSSGSIQYFTGTTRSEISALLGLGSEGFSTDATYPGIYKTVANAANYGFHFTKNQSGGLSTQAANYPFFNIFGTWGGLLNLGVNYTMNIVRIAPTYNYTGTDVISAIGLDYSPTVTSLTGTHYGFLFRTPSALNGIGLASAMPTALLHLAGSTTTRASLRIESGTLPTGADHHDGDFTYDGTDLNFRVGSVTKLIEFQPISQTVNATTGTTSIDLSAGNVILLNLQTATTALTLNNIRVGTYIIIVKQDGTGGRLMTYTTTMNFAGGVAPTLTTTANFSDILTVVYDGTNIRTTVAQNFAV